MEIYTRIVFKDILRPSQYHREINEAFTSESKYISKYK